jgi:hypothetical protein
MGTPLFSEETLKASLLKPRAVFLPLAEFFAVFGPCSLEPFRSRAAKLPKGRRRREDCHPEGAYRIIRLRHPLAMVSGRATLLFSPVVIPAFSLSPARGKGSRLFNVDRATRPRPGAKTWWHACPIQRPRKKFLF